MNQADTSGALTQRWRSYALLAVVMLFWSGNVIVGRAVRGDIPPLTFALLRWIGAASLALPFAWRPVMADRAVLLASWRPLLLLSLTGVVAFNSFVYTGLRHSTATNGMLLLAAIPAMVLLVNRLLFGVRAGVAELCGVLLSTVGVLLIVLRGDPFALLKLAFSAGDLLILAGVLCWAAYTSLLRLRPACDPWSFVFVTFAIGMVVMIPLAATEIDAIATVHWGPKVLAAIAYVAVLPSLVAYLLYNAAVKSIGAARAGQTISLMPLFGSLLAALILGEQLHGYHLAGMALILGGILVSALLQRR